MHSSHCRCGPTVGTHQRSALGIEQRLQVVVFDTGKGGPVFVSPRKFSLCFRMILSTSRSRGRAALCLVYAREQLAHDPKVAFLAVPQFARIESVLGSAASGTDPEIVTGSAKFWECEPPPVAKSISTNATGAPRT